MAGPPKTFPRFSIDLVSKTKITPHTSYAEDQHGVLVPSCSFPLPSTGMPIWVIPVVLVAFPATVDVKQWPRVN